MSYGHFLSKNNSKIHSQEAKHNEGNLALPWHFRKSFLQVVFRTFKILFEYGTFPLSYGHFGNKKIAQNAFPECYNGYFLANRDVFVLTEYFLFKGRTSFYFKPYSGQEE